MTVEYADDLPLGRDAVAPFIEEHAERFSAVLSEALDGYFAAADACDRMVEAGAAARGMLIADFTRKPALRHFGALVEADVDLRHGYPWVSLAAGTIQVRFKKLTPSLAICPSDTERATRLAYHLGDPALPGLPAATVITVGYVLHPVEPRAERLVAVCHLGPNVHYWIDLPLEGRQEIFPTTLPIVPLSPPLIRSARISAAQKIEEQKKRIEEGGA